MTPVRPRLQVDYVRAADWRASAACLGMDPRLFFPEPRTGGGEADKERIHEQTERARGVCTGGCPVLPACLEWAIEHGEVGVWGGTTDREREKIKRNRNRRPAA